MTTSRLWGGSRISARDRAPSVNLSRLAELLAKSIEANGAAGADGLPLVSVADSMVRINVRGVLGRLLKHTDFESAFAPGEETGFLRDAELPPFGMAAKMGGRLVQGSEASTSKAINALRDAITTQLDRGLEGFDVASLCVDELRSAVKTMAATIGTNPPELPQAATMVAVQFADAGRPVFERERDIGRVLSGIETVDGRDWLQLVLSGIEVKLKNDNVEQDDIDEVTTAIRNQSTKPGSQVRRFLDFLEDEAMARVRLQVCMRLMSAVAAQSGKPGFKSYVRRVRECFEAFAGADGESLALEVGAVYGVANNVELAEELRKAMFYNCLPAWAEGSVQLFERRIDPVQNQPTLREVSYRFRVNGMNPLTGKPAFESRLDRHYGRLLEDPSTGANIKRSLAEVVFLSLVVPSSMADENPGNVAAEAATIAADMKADPIGTLTQLHASLLKRRHVVDDLAEELIRILRSKSTSLVTAANRSADKLSVTVHRNIVDWAVVKGMSSANEDILVKPPNGPDTIAWFNHIRVSENSWPGGIASFLVETQLQERSLALVGDTQEVRMGKSLSDPVLPVRLVPYTWSKSESAWSPAVPNLKVLATGNGVEVEYDLRLLTLKRTKDEEKARSEQFRTTMVAGAGLLAYMALWELVQRVKAHAPNLTMTLVRLQRSGKSVNREADSHDGNTAIYAVSQAIEKALARELPVEAAGVDHRQRRQGQHPLQEQGRARCAARRPTGLL